VKRAANGIKKILRVEFAPDTKAAADIVFDHVDRILSEPHLGRKYAPVEKRHLARP
jgi:hypothetical protein